MQVKGPGASSHSFTMPSARKRVRHWGNVGVSPRSPFTSNLTCFFGFFSAGVGMSCHCDLLLDLCTLVCKSRFFIEWLSCSSAGLDHMGLGKGD